MLRVTFIGLFFYISGFLSPVNGSRVKRNPCDEKPNGNYSIHDVFKYLVCKDRASSYMKCQDNFVFSPDEKHCVKISTQSQKSFCKSRPNGNYNDPWNCHKFIVCSHGSSYPYECQKLVFNPYIDQCVYENDYPCYQILAVKQDPCNGKRDGNYPIQDVFKYIFCKDGVSYSKTCQDNFVYWPGANQCVNISSQSKSNFCKSRPDGDYNDPWNCHKFFKCFQEYSYQFDCQNLVFNPYTDQCVYKKDYVCRQVSGLQDKKEIVEEQDDNDDVNDEQGFDEEEVIRSDIEKEILDDLEDIDVELDDSFQDDDVENEIIEDHMDDDNTRDDDNTQDYL